MFGRRKREEAAAEAAREAERRELFARLAQRPDTVCPFLGMAAERTAYRDGADDDHRCYAFGDPAPLSHEQQTRVCLERGYGNCPRYLRGVLVIPTEELEALRRPREARPIPPAAPAPEPRERRSRTPLLALLALLLVLGGGAAAAWIVLDGAALIGGGDPTPVPTVGPPPPPTGSPDASPDTSPAVTDTPTAEPTADATPTPDPTVAPGDEFDFFEVGVSEGDYLLFQVSAAGEVVGQRAARFSRFSRAEVDLVEAPSGLRHWRTLEGEYAGLSYIYPDSGDFVVREVYRRPDGSRSSEEIPEAER